MTAKTWISVAAAGLISISATTAARAQNIEFRVSAGRLGDVAASLGVQARATVVVPDPDVAIQPSPGVTGRMTLRTAVARILSGTPAVAVFQDSLTVRILPGVGKKAAVRRKETETVAGEDIIVSASKQKLTVNTYPGSLKVMDLSQAWAASNGAQGSSAISNAIPSISTTNLGPGRNKLFIRGIADSSFTGQTQATVGEYLGNVRLNYSAPDPDLNLYDIRRVEVLVGPQGALYGAGSLGGIVRLVPNQPDSARFEASAAANVGLTRHGELSRDGQGMVNLPIAEGVAARLVAWGGFAGGYIDAPASERKYINRSRRYGERLSVRTDDLSGWTVDLGLVFQNINGDDGQYTLRQDPEFSRDSAIPQPFKNKYRLGFVSAGRKIGQADFNTTTSLSLHELTTVYDAKGFDEEGTPARYAEDNETVLFSHETRLSGGSRAQPWVAGVSVIVNSNNLERELATPVLDYDIPGVVNLQSEVAAFGELAKPITATLTGTIGGRLTYSSIKGYLTGSSYGGPTQFKRRDVRFSGTFALDWHPGGALSGFFHHQQGYRAGGLGFGLSEAGLASERFDPDDLHMNEVGLRLGDPLRDRVSLRAAFFIADWRNIQADLIGVKGFAYTANIGRGIINGVDADISWSPTLSLTLSAAAFLNDSSVSKLRDGIVVSDDPEVANIARTLPGVARAGARASAEWRREIASDTFLKLNASLRYVGKSQLGIGKPLDVSQGGYAIANADARLEHGRYGITFAIDNLGDTYGNTFAFGNPFGLWRRDQITPLRPITLRFGLDARW